MKHTKNERAEKFNILRKEMEGLLFFESMKKQGHYKHFSSDGHNFQCRSKKRKLRGGLD